MGYALEHPLVTELKPLVDNAIALASNEEWKNPNSLVLFILADVWPAVYAAKAWSNKADAVPVLCALVTYAYKQVDPDLPYIPEPYETMLEDLLLQTVLPRLAEAMVNNEDK